MLLIVSEHLNEIKPLIDYLNLEKSGELFIGNDLAVFVNYGQGGLKLGYRTAYHLAKSDFTLVLLFGFSAALSSAFDKGEFVFLRETKLLDASKTPIYNPVELLTAYGYRSATGLTIMGRLFFDNRYLGGFGDLVDRESYFFAEAAKGAGVAAAVLRVISDFNRKDEIKDVYRFKYDVDRLARVVNDIKNSDREIFLHTGLVGKRAEALKRLFSKRHFTFSQRQMLYREIKINLSRIKRSRFRPEIVFVEKGVDRSRIKIDLSRFKTEEMDDYVAYFHNLKDRSAIIFASKKGEFLRKTPSAYTPDGSSGYSILASYNCIYDCAYCFLKGYFRSFNPVIFLNYEDYFTQIERVVRVNKKRPLYFYLGTFSDPVALAFLSNQLDSFVDFFSSLDRGVILEIRTKSANVSFLTERFKPSENILFAFSLSPEIVRKRYEFYTPSLNKRVDAMRELSMKGFGVAARLDPVIFEFFEDYAEILDMIEGIERLHSVEIGFLRFDRQDFKRMLKKNPAILKGLVYENGMYRYSLKKRKEMENFFRGRFRDFYLSMEW